MNRFASLTEWMKGDKIIKVRSEMVPMSGGLKSTIPVATVEILTPEENLAIKLVNESGIEDLTSVKGIGPKTASKIISSRPFSSFKDLSEQVNLHSDVLERLQAWGSS